MDVFKQQKYTLKSAYCHSEVGADHSILMSQKEHGTRIEQHLSDKTLPTTNQLSISDGGILLVWGCGEFGQHGHGHQNDISLINGVCYPLLIGQDGIVTMVACGSSHTICVTDDNRIYSWGNGNSGQLGIGKTTTVFQPNVIQLGVSLGTRIKDVACGTRHTFVWTEEGECYSFGNNFSAQLGYDFRKPDFKENQPSPAYLEFLFNQKVLQVACGSRHSLFLFSSGLVASVGCNDRGQLGLDSKTSSVCIKTVPDIQDIAVIGCGNCHCLAVDGSGNVYVWGYGKACGSKDDILSPKSICKYESKSIKTVDGGDSHSMFLLDDGSLFSWGVNFEGQLGQGECINFQSFPTEIKSEALQGKVSSISVGENTSAAITGDGLLFMWGRNVSQVFRHDEGPRYCQFVPYLVPLANWKATKVSCGSWHVACIVHSSTKEKTDSVSQDHLSDQDQDHYQDHYQDYLSDIHYKNKEDVSVFQPIKNRKEKGAPDVTGSDAFLTPIHQETFDTEDVTNYNHDKETTTLRNPEELKTDQYICSDKELGYVTTPATESIINQNSKLIFVDRSLVCSESDLKIQANNDMQESCNKQYSMHDFNEVSMEICNSIERTCNLRRTQSEDSFSIHDPVHGNLNHFSKSLYDFTTEKCQVKNTVQVWGSSTGELTSDSMHDHEHSEYKTSNSDINDDAILKGSKTQDNDGNPVIDSASLSSTDTKPIIDYSHSASVSSTDTTPIIDSSHSTSVSSTDTTPIIDSSHSASVSNTDTKPIIDSSHSASVSNTDTKPIIDYSHSASVSSTNTKPIIIDSSHSATVSSTNTNLRVSGQAVGQLNREKKPPRHLRKVPSSMECISDPKKQSLGHTKDRRCHYSDQLQRAQSSPTMNISSLQLEVFPSSQSTPTTPPSSSHVPHPPSKSTDGLPPRHPGPRRSHSQKIVYSSGSSWRKRNSNMM